MITSPANCWARKIPNADFPEAVGPTIASSGGSGEVGIIEREYANCESREARAPPRRAIRRLCQSDFAASGRCYCSFAASIGRLYRKIKRKRISGPENAGGKWSNGFEE